VRFFGPEGADSGQIELKFWPIYPVETINHLIGSTSVYIADKAQGYVIILHINPPGTR